MPTLVNAAVSSGVSMYNVKLTIITVLIYLINPLNPHDALKHHFTSLKTDLIFQQTRVLERTFTKNWFANT